MSLADIKPRTAILGIVGGCTALFAVLISVQAMAHRHDDPALTQKPAMVSTPGPQPLSPPELIKTAKSYLDDPSPDHFSEAENCLNRVPSSAPEYKEAGRLKASIPPARLKYRLDITHDLQEAHRASGENVKVTLTGAHRENVEFYWAGLTMSDVASMQRAFGTLRDFRDSGCKTFTMTDGVGIRQEIDLTTVP